MKYYPVIYKINPLVEYYIASKFIADFSYQSFIKWKIMLTKDLLNAIR